MTKEDWQDSTGAEEYFRAVIESTADGILVVDGEGRVVSSNQRFADLWRLPEELLATRDDEQLLAAALEQLVEPQAFLRKVHELYGSSAESLDFLHFKDGRVFERFSAPLIRNGEATGRVWSFRDITRRVRAEEERRRLESRIRDTQRLESLGVLAGGIAHDFNNLLVGILGNADLVMQRGMGDSLSHELIEDIVDAAARAAELCNELLAYSGKGSFIVKPVNLSDVVLEMSHLLEVSISKSVDIHYRFTEELPAIDADPSQLRQVVMNLITNASEAIGSARGEILIGTELLVCERAFLASTLLGAGLEEGEYVCLSVADTGSGMDEETQRKIYEPFFSTKATGRGLGLAAILGIMRGHGGTIQVHSEPDQGSTFRVLFPASRHAPASPPAEARARCMPERGRVLVVDDEESVRTVATRILASAGYEVLTAPDGPRAVDLFRAQKGRIGAVLLDLTMPGMDGVETLQRLRELDPDVSVVLSSGYHSQTTKKRFVGEEAPASFLQKPYRSALLMRQIGEAVALRRSAGAAGSGGAASYVTTR